ncbi:MAG: glycerol-3-phosphate 1-O-acyltransferase PlsY [Candidatus Bipolaricaulota bacterium]
MAFVAAVVVAYLIGGFPTSVVLGRLCRGMDVRQHGSGNAGATNAWRVLGWRIGLVVLLLDAAKGAVASTLLPRLAGTASPVPNGVAAVVCGLAAVVGHVYPIYLRFRGGKGVATGAGMLAALAPLPVALAVGGFAIVVIATGWISLGSLVAAWLVPVFVAVWPSSSDAASHAVLLGVTAALAAFLTLTHRANVRRLLRGEERRFPSLQIWRRFVGRKRA